MDKTKLFLFLFLAPAVILIGLYAYCFNAWNIFFSLTNARSFVARAEFVGLSNYARLISDSSFLRALRNTAVFSALFIGGSILLGLLLAILIDQGIKGERIYKVIILLPMAMPMVISGVLWAWMYSPELGMLNSLLRALHLDFLTQPWITSTNQALFCVVIAYIWVFTGFVSLLYLANMRSLPEDQVESALVEGASRFQLYRHIIIPQLIPATIMAVAILVLNSLAAFDLIWSMTGGGPAGSSDVLGTLMYKKTFQWNFIGYGAAVAEILFLICLAIMVPFLCLVLRRQKG